MSFFLEGILDASTHFQYLRSCCMIYPIHRVWDAIKEAMGETALQSLIRDFRRLVTCEKQVSLLHTESSGLGRLTYTGLHRRNEQRFGANLLPYASEGAALW